MKPEDKSEAERTGRQLKRHRHRLGLSIRTLAERVDLSPQMVQKYESGKSLLTSQKIKIFCEAFGISQIEFLEESEPFEARETRYNHLGPQEERLLVAFHRLTEKIQRKAVVDLVESMAFGSDQSSNTR